MRDYPVLWRWIRNFVLVLIVVFALLWFMDSHASELQRSRYSFVSASNSLIFYNVDVLPFQIIREMCWNNRVGWCDSEMQTYAQEIWIVIDWQSQEFGSIRQIGNDCFWWMYRQEYGADNQPHITERHYWIECPVLVR